MTIIFATLAGLVPLTVLLLIGFGIFSVIKKKDGTAQADEKPHAVDVMYYIGMFISLITSLGALIGILFSAIDHKYRDALDIGQYYDELSVGNDVRISVSVLLVAFPIYLVLAWLLTGRIKKDMERLKLVIRNVYIYSILLVTTLTVAGSLISIIYNYLSGELSSRFLAKSLVLLVLAGLTLGYHIFLLKRDYTKNGNLGIALSALAGLLVLGSIVYGINETGSPKEVRARKFDDKRLQDLSGIQSNILQKWQRDGKLPSDLASLTDTIGGNVIAVDPQTKTPYEYKVIQNSELVDGVVNASVVPTYKYAADSVATISGTRMGKIAKTDAVFELCATFASVRDVASRSGQNIYTASTPLRVPEIGLVSPKYALDAGYYYNDNNPTWDHKAERTCFKRTISKDQYQVYGN